MHLWQNVLSSAITELRSAALPFSCFLLFSFLYHVLHCESEKNELFMMCVCLTGHGGNGFLKFQDSEEISNVELADAFEQMWQKRR